MLTPGEAHETTAVDRLAALVARKPKALLGDRAYDSNRIRSDLVLQGIEPVIPSRKGRTDPPDHDRQLYRERNRIERLVGHLKENRRLATRYDKTAGAFLGMVNLAAIKLWLKFVNRA